MNHKNERIFNKILAIGAHPDDIEFSCAGFLLKQKKLGAQVHILIMSKGENGNNGDGSQRKAEQEAAQSLSQFDSLHLGAFKDGGIGFSSATIDFIEKIIREIEPDLILTHYPEDWHQDHIHTALSSRAACRTVPKLWYYRSYSAIHFNPLIYVDISTEASSKRNLLELFHSQIDKNLAKGIDFARIAMEYNRSYGNEVGVEYAEGFVPYRYLI